MSSENIAFLLAGWIAASSTGVIIALGAINTSIRSVANELKKMNDRAELG